MRNVIKSGSGVMDFSSRKVFSGKNLCHEFSFRYFSLSEQRSFWTGDGNPLYCGLCTVVLGNQYKILFLLLFSYTSPIELTQSLCKVK